MNTAVAIVAIMAMLLTAVPSGATSESEIPYIEIQYPEDGSTVGIKEVLVVIAEGFNLRNPSFSVEGVSMGFGAPLTNCVYSVSDSEDGKILSEEPIISKPGTMKMYCKQELDLSSFEGEKVRVSVSVADYDYMIDSNLGIERILTDSVGLFVSGHCA